MLWLFRRYFSNKRFLFKSKQSLQIKQLSSVDEIVAVGKALNNIANNPISAQSYLKDGIIFSVSKNSQILYLIWIKKSDKLIPGGMYFGKNNNNFPIDEDKKNFKEVTKILIAKNQLNPKIFSATDNYSKFYLS